MLIKCSKYVPLKYGNKETFINSIQTTDEFIWSETSLANGEHILSYRMNSPLLKYLNNFCVDDDVMKFGADTQSSEDAL